MNPLSPWPDITYFVGSPAEGVLAPVHYASVHHAEHNAGFVRGAHKHLFVYRNEELLLTIDSPRLWFRGYIKWGGKDALNSIHGKYSWEDLYYRYVRCAVFKALRAL